MAISLTCRCKTNLEVEDHLAGTLVRCPRCGESLMVPRPAAAAAATESGSVAEDDDDDAYQLAPLEPLPPKKPACPSCGTDLPSGAVLCVQCGYHLQLKKHMG